MQLVLRRVDLVIWLINMRAFQIISASLLVSLLLLASPFVVRAQDPTFQVVPAGCASNAAQPCQFNDLIRLAGNVIDIILAAVVVLFAFSVAAAGFMMFTSAGNEGRYSTGKTILMYAVIGLAVTLSAKGIVLFVESALGVKDGFQVENITNLGN